MDFHRAIEKIIEKDPRYKADAYEFVMQALWFTQKRLDRNAHVTGKELLNGIREFGLAEYGPMAKMVFEHWGVKSTYDFGAIVFNMVDNKLMSKTDEDSIDDFKDIYNFDKAFEVF